MSAADVRCSVFLLSQNRLLREVLGRLIDEEGDLHLLGSSSLSSQTADSVAAASPQVVLLDLPCQDSCVEFLRALLLRLPATRIVFMGFDSDRQQFLRAVREGAVGFVLQDSASAEIIAAVRSVFRGEVVCPNHLCLALFEYVSRQASSVPSLYIRTTLGLTSREQQMLRLISRGLSNKEIARELNLAEQTIRNHVHRVLRKVGTHDRFAAVEICRIQGLAV